MARLPLVLLLVATSAAADPLPKTGDAMALAPYAKLQWNYEAPSDSDAAGKIVIHWFCATTPKAFAKSCDDDLARIINLRDTGKVYVIAYIAGTQRDAKKLDPIRESEGVGRGTVAYGPGVIKLQKQMGITAPTSIVVDVDGKVRAVTTSADINELDARDKLVDSLAGAIKDFTTSYDGPKTAKPGEKFQLSFKVQLANWLSFSNKSPTTFDVTGPKELKCGAAEQKVEGHTLTMTTTCTAPKGVYEAQGHLRFGYATPSGATGAGEDGATYKFEIK
jgi:hypothetical protein